MHKNPRSHRTSMRTKALVCASLCAASADGLRMPGMKPTVAPTPPAGFTWGLTVGMVVPTAPVKKVRTAAAVVAPKPVKEVVAAPEPVAVPEPTVVSWYDSGIRMEPAAVEAEASPAPAKVTGVKRAAIKAFFSKVFSMFSKQEEWPSQGGIGGPHCMRGPYPPPPVRVEWVPPAGWTPPSKPVSSWYDNGVRMTPPVNSWYDKGIRMKPTGWPTF